MRDKLDFAKLVSKLSDAKILCVGDLMLDRFIDGDVKRISPEAPIPVLSIKSEISLPGGAGNVARNLSALGASCHLIACVGNDDNAVEIKKLMAELKNFNSDLKICDDRPTSVKNRYMANGQQLLRVDNELIAPLAKDIADDIIKTAINALDDNDILILSDYGKGVLSDDVIKKLIAAANMRKIPVIIDPKGNDYNKYRGADLITPNKQELSIASNMRADCDDNIIAACQYLIKTCGIKSILATRSEQGMSLVSSGGKIINKVEITHFDARTREVFDVSGAGDTVVAVMAAVMAVGGKLITAARVANNAAGIVVGKIGTAVVYPSEILSANHENIWQVGEDKVMLRVAAIDKIGAWRRKGYKIGFTNGCFDLLHPGHISLINQAKSNCDKLILGLNSDQSVRRLKGNSRPVQNETSRATVLSSLSNVDMVVIFGDDTPLDLICDLKPNILVKGADYSLAQVVGAKEIVNWGGKVILADLLDGQSTSNTIKKINS